MTYSSSFQRPREKGTGRAVSHRLRSCCLLGKTEDYQPFSQHFISQCASSKGSLEAVSEPSPIGVPISRSCQRQANSLRRWLELSQEEPSCEDLHLEEQVKTELEEVSKVRPRSAQGQPPAVLLQLPCPSLPRWNYRSSSWLRSSRPSGSLLVHALLMFGS